MARKIVLGVLFVILVVCFWNLFEFFYDAVIAHIPYRFEFGTSIAVPMAVGMIVYLVIFITDIFKKKKRQKDDTPRNHNDTTQQ